MRNIGYLILVRHGESRWNLANKFTGWVDVPLSEVGIHEALITAEKLDDLQIDVAFTSKLVRAQETLLLILAHQQKTGVFLHTSRKRRTWSKHEGGEFGEDDIPIYSSDKLNERYYGALQGMNKDQAREQFGKEQVFVWRRSFDVRPPKGESLKDVCKRVVPYFQKEIMPHIKAGKNVMISAHGNSLRALIKHLDDISDEDIPHLELELGKPIIYLTTATDITLVNHEHGFDRPIHWQGVKKHLSDYKTAKKTSEKN